MVDATAEERWLPIPGWEGYYEVSDHGRVRSVPRTIVQRNGVVKVLRGKPLVPGDDGMRLLVGLCRPGVHQTRKVHQLVLEAFVGPKPAGMLGRHLDDNYLDNRLANLRWGTQTDNMQDCLRNGGNDRANRTHCPRLHLLEAPNLVPSELRERGRKCLACSRARNMASRRAREGLVRFEDVDMQRLSDTYYAEVLATGGRPRVRPRHLRHDIPLPMKRQE